MFGVYVGDKGILGGGFLSYLKNISQIKLDHLPKSRGTPINKWLFKPPPSH